MSQESRPSGPLVLYVEDEPNISDILIAYYVARVRDEEHGEEAQPLPLTLTEYRLLAHLATQPRRCFSRSELIEACLPESDALDRVIDSHLSKLRRKLLDGGCGNLIETVRGIGYQLWPKT